MARVMRPWYDAKALFVVALALYAVGLLASAQDWRVVGHLSLGTTCRTVAGTIGLLRTWRRETKQEHGQDPNRE